MRRINFGISLWSQQTSWPAYLAAAMRIDGLGYDHLWTWDHLLAAVGDPNQPVFEGYATLAAWAALTSRVRLGLLVGANTFRNPAIVAKAIATIDHISGGRALLGLGGAWLAREHAAYGIPFGAGIGERLDWLDEALSVIEPLLKGSESSHVGSRYATDRLILNPPTVQPHIPIMIGGSGEKKTLRTVARYADMWNAAVSVDEARHKIEVLTEHCGAIGRDASCIELSLNCKVLIRNRDADARSVMKEQFAVNHTTTQERGDRAFWVGPPELIATYMQPYVDLGFETFICELLAPYDDETIVRLVGEVKPLVQRA